MNNRIEDAPTQGELHRKKNRKPFGAQIQKLAYEPRIGYHRHWFNDRPGRVQQALEAGYTHVKDAKGNNVSLPVGVNDSGGALVAFLMEIPEEWYKEDMAAQQAKLDQLHESIKAGSLNEQPGENRYIPSQGISIKSGRP